VQYKDDRLVAPGALLCEHMFEPLAGLPERAERVAEGDREVDPGDDAALFELLRDPAEGGLDDDR